jgi:putative transposase
MASLPRVCLGGIPQYVIQRGNSRHVCCASELDFETYTNWLKACAKKFQVDLHAWVLIMNHVGLLRTSRVDNAVSHLM